MDVQPAVSLFDKLHLIRQRSSKGTYFISFTSLKETLQREVIASEVVRICQQGHQLPQIIDIILKNGLRVFAILVLLRQEELILNFIESSDEHIDAKLPFEKSSLTRIAPTISHRFATEVQWELIPHIFRVGGYYRKLDDTIVLPFVDERKLDEGTGGVIHECTIAAGQHNFAASGVKFDP
jgi:hypothetical protein